MIFTSICANYARRRTEKWLPFTYETVIYLNRKERFVQSDDSGYYPKHESNQKSPFLLTEWLFLIFL